MIYRENGRRYIPVKFSVRGRDLSSTIQEMQRRLAQQIHLPEGYHYEWAGEYDSLRKEQRRLEIVLPLTLLVIFGLLFTAFNSLRHALLVLVMLPFAACGGVLSLVVTGTPFSISAAVGFASIIGVCTLGGVVFVSGIRRKEAGATSMHVRHRAGRAWPRCGRWPWLAPRRDSDCCRRRFPAGSVCRRSSRWRV
jgi:cobalt-zinc-cadmium resistance protein CzcA